MNDVNDDYLHAMLGELTTAHDPQQLVNMWENGTESIDIYLLPAYKFALLCCALNQLVGVERMLAKCTKHQILLDVSLQSHVFHLIMVNHTFFHDQIGLLFSKLVSTESLQRVLRSIYITDFHFKMLKFSMLKAKIHRSSLFYELLSVFLSPFTSNTLTIWKNELQSYMETKFNGDTLVHDRTFDYYTIKLHVSVDEQYETVVIKSPTIGAVFKHLVPDFYAQWIKERTKAVRHVLLTNDLGETGPVGVRINAFLGTARIRKR